VKIRHILKTGEFAEIIENGEKLRGKTVNAYVKKGGQDREPSVGIVISKKFAPKAVKRNYARRLIYSYFQGNDHTWRSGVRIVIRVVRDISAPGRRFFSREIKEDLENLTRKAGIRK
jgi:ribonuclease P protein component